MYTAMAFDSALCISIETGVDSAAQGDRWHGQLLHVLPVNSMPTTAVH